MRSALAEFEASLRHHFASLSGKQGLTRAEAVATALRIAAGASPPPLDAPALAAAAAAFVAAWRAAPPGEVPPAARAALAAAAAAAFSPDVLARSFLLADDAEELPDASRAADPPAAAALAKLSLDVAAAEAAFAHLEEARLRTDMAADVALQRACAAALDALAPPAGAPAPARRAATAAAASGASLRCALLLLLACPALRDPGWHALLRRLLRHVATLPPGPARLAQLALCALPAPRFTALINVRCGASHAVHALATRCQLTRCARLAQLLHAFILTRVYEHPDGRTEPLQSAATLMARPCVCARTAARSARC